VDANALAELEPELRALLNAWDPIGVSDVVDDEYDCMIAPVLSVLARGVSKEEMGQYLRSELDGHFGLAPETREPDRFGAELVTWFRSKGGAAGPTPG
jgi:hypothetical protein